MQIRVNIFYLRPCDFEQIYGEVIKKFFMKMYEMLSIDILNRFEERSLACISRKMEIFHYANDPSIGYYECLRSF